MAAPAVLILSTGLAGAVDLSFQPRASLGYQSYTFDVAGSNFEVDTDYVLGGLGLTVQGGRFFVDLYGQTNLTDAEYDDEDILDTNGLNQDSEVDRYEVNLTLGYAVTPNISVFGGLKYAENEINSDLDSDLVDIGDSFFDIDVEYLGPFVGASLAVPVANAGALAFSGSTAYLFGEATIDAEVAGNVIADNQEVDGEAIGFNLGVAWIGGLEALSPSLSGLGYTVGIDYSTYDFEDGDTDEFSEETLRGKVDLKYTF